MTNEPKNSGQRACKGSWARVWTILPQSSNLVSASSTKLHKLDCWRLDSETFRLQNQDSRISIVTDRSRGRLSRARFFKSALSRARIAHRILFLSLTVRLHFALHRWRQKAIAQRNISLPESSSHFISSLRARVSRDLSESLTNALERFDSLTLDPVPNRSNRNWVINIDIPEVMQQVRSIYKARVASSAIRKCLLDNSLVYELAARRTRSLVAQELLNDD